MATKKSLSILLSLLMVFTLISLFPTVSGEKGECQPQGLCGGKKPVKTCNAKCISLGYKLGGICLNHNDGPNKPTIYYCCCNFDG
ncbi:hypothetical protein Bca4012_037522 [Brassica carinata]